MLEGLWTAEFESEEGWTNGGVVVFETNRLFGGDMCYYYVGNYRAGKGKRVSAEFRAVHYHGPIVTVFGLEETAHDVVFRGKRSGDTIVGKIHRPEAPQKTLPARLTRRADLP